MARPQTFTDDDLRKVARRAFLEGGSDVSLQAIARQLGVTAAAVLHRCGCKEALIKWTFLSETPAVVPDFSLQPRTRASAQDHLVSMLSQFGSQIANRSAAFLLLVGSLPRPEKGCELRTVYDRERDGLEHWLRQSMNCGTLPPKDPAVACELLLGALESRHVRAFMAGRPHSELEERQYVRSLVHGLFDPAPRVEGSIQVNRLQVVASRGRSYRNDELASVTID